MTGKKNGALKFLIATPLFNKHGWTIALSAMFCFCSFLSFAEEVVAQNRFQGPAKPRKPYNNDNEFVPETLKQPPDLPFLPPYAGSSPTKYDSILAFKRKSDGPGYSLSFHVKETPDEVIAFYKNAFKSNKWDPQKNGDTTKIVSGMRKGAVATVTVMKPVLKGYRTQVYLVYKVSGQIQ